jgi:hypothetical protein
VIYWAWNNLLSILQQYTIMKRNGAEIHLWKNMGVDKAMARVRSGEGIGAGELIERAGATVRGGVEKLTRQAEGLKRAVVAKLQPGGGASAPSRPADGGADGGAAAPAGDGSVAPPKADMTREQALEALGLAPGATPSEIEAAYKARARQNGSLNGSGTLSQARDVLRGEG